jgi:hypothetical protein
VGILRDLWHLFLAGLLAIVALIAIAGLKLESFSHRVGAHSGTTAGASTSAILNVLPTTRSITVSPGLVTFSNCHGGNSTPTLLGFPNGRCTVGKIHAHGPFPITIQNTGMPSSIGVSASNALPVVNGPQWRLCSAAGHPKCTGPGGKPGLDQYEAWTTERGEVSPTGLTASFACDVAFDPSSGCAAARGQSGTEGIKLTGPAMFSNPAPSYTITITWIAVP